MSIIYSTIEPDHPCVTISGKCIDRADDQCGADSAEDGESDVRARALRGELSK